MWLLTSPLSLWEMKPETFRGAITRGWVLTNWRRSNNTLPSRISFRRSIINDLISIAISGLTWKWSHYIVLIFVFETSRFKSFYGSRKTTLSTKTISGTVQIRGLCLIRGKHLKDKALTTELILWKGMRNCISADSILTKWSGKNIKFTDHIKPIHCNWKYSCQVHSSLIIQSELQDGSPVIYLTLMFPKGSIQFFRK